MGKVPLRRRTKPRPFLHFGPSRTFQQHFGKVEKQASETIHAANGRVEMSPYDDLSEEEFDEIRSFIKKNDIDVVSHDLRRLVEKRWQWLLPKLSGGRPFITPSATAFCLLRF